MADVAATDDVAGAGNGGGSAGEAANPGLGQQIGHCLRRAVGIVTTEGVGFDVTGLLVDVAVDLVGGHDDVRTHRRGGRDGLQHV